MSQYAIPQSNGDPYEIDASIMTSGAAWRRAHVLITLMLALLTTTTSVGIAVMSGLVRAVALPEQVACVALSVAAVIGAHMLPALSRGNSIVARCIAAGLCAVSLLVVFYGQVTFFLTTQRRAGDERAEAVVARSTRQPQGATLARSVMAIASDEEKARAMLANNDARHCDDDCSARRRRHDLLEAKLGLLATEEHEAKRREVEDDRQDDLAERLRDSMREDPATARLARATGVDEQTLDLVVALVCAGVLDLTASFCWYLVLARSRNRTVTEASSVVTIDDPSRREHAEVDDYPTRDLSASIVDDTDGRLMQLAHDVAAGRVRPTVDGIREHFNCAQKTANQLRRKYQALSEAIQSAAVRN